MLEQRKPVEECECNLKGALGKDVLLALVQWMNTDGSISLWIFLCAFVTEISGRTRNHTPGGKATSTESASWWLGGAPGAAIEGVIHTTEVLVMYEFNVSKSCIHHDKHVNNIKVGC